MFQSDIPLGGVIVGILLSLLFWIPLILWIVL